MTTLAPRQTPEAVTLYRPLVEKVIGALGALITHQIAYLIVSLLGLRFTTLSDHGHLSLQWAIVAPLAVGAAAGLIIWQLQGLGFRTAMSVRYLSGLIAGFFVIQETIEGLAGGLAPTEIMTHPAVLTGLAIAPLIAWLLSRVMTGATELVARLIGDSDFGYPTERAVLIPVPVRDTSTNVGSRSRPRAPPSTLRT